MPEAPCLLVIGYGNSLRRDDGAGLLLAELLADIWESQGRPVRLLLAHQLGPEIALDIAEPDVSTVLFVDAAAQALPQAELTPVAVTPKSQSLTHQLSPETLLLYAARLFNRHPQGWLLRVGGHDFAHGESLSPATASAVEEAGRQAEHWWRLMAGGGGTNHADQVVKSFP